MNSAQQDRSITASVEYGAKYLDYQLQKSWLRKLVRQAYIRRMRSRCVGKVIDYGCGPGTVLAHLPEGSVGLEINSAAVEYARSCGMDVRLSDSCSEESIRSLPAQGFESLLCAHVLEHLDNPEVDVLGMMRAGVFVGLKRLVFVVPGAAGFRSDDTHRTFIDREFFERVAIIQNAYTLTEYSYFPCDLRWIGDWFKYHELMAVFDLKDVIS